MKIINSIILIAFLLTGCHMHCGHDHSHSHDHDDHEHEVKLKLFAYNDIFEVFAELDPLATGQESEIAAHFTKMEDFKPLEADEVKAELKIGNSIISQVSDNPSKKGIYIFKITPEAPGEGSLTFYVTKGTEVTVITIGDIIVFTDPDQAELAAEALKIDEVNTVEFSREQAWKTYFAIGFPEEMSFGPVIRTTGQILPAPGDEILLTARSSGIIRYSSGNLSEGSRVLIGQTLFSVSTATMIDNNTKVMLAEAKSNYDRAISDYERKKTLANEKIVSEKDLATARNEYEKTKAVFENLSDNYNMAGYDIKSNMSGFIKQLMVANGAFVETGQPVMTISQNRKLQMRAEIYPQDMQKISSFTDINMRTLYDGKIYKLSDFNGKLLSVGRIANPDNFMIPITFELDNSGSLIAGSLVELNINTMTNARALTVPNTAIVEEQGIYSVFVQLHPELYEKRMVKTGSTDGSRIEILGGIEYTDRIVTEGAIILKLAMATGALDAHAGHHH